MASNRRFGEVDFAIQKLDSGDGVNEESGCSVTQQVDVFVARPPLQLTPPREFRKFVFQEEPDVAVDQRGVDIVQNEDVGRVHEERETESGLDPRLWSTGDEELDPGNLFNEPPQNGEDRRRRFVVLAFVECVDHDHRRNPAARSGSTINLCIWL
jgi:hypothetical protein